MAQGKNLASANGLEGFGAAAIGTLSPTRRVEGLITEITALFGTCKQDPEGAQPHLLRLVTEVNNLITATQDALDGMKIRAVGAHGGLVSVLRQFCNGLAAEILAWLGEIRSGVPATDSRIWAADILNSQIRALEAAIDRLEEPDVAL